MPDATPDTIHETALERFKVAVAAEEKQRKRELEAIKFANGDQWEDYAKSMRKGTQDGLIRVADRPCLTINKLKQPLQQLENQQRAARLGVEIKPKSSGANEKTAEMIAGLYRTIETESRAQIARGWAYARALKAGRGFYLVRTGYANDGDFDQDILIERILNQGSVFLDPFAQQPDWSDGEWGFITDDMPWSKYKRQFKDSEMAQMDDEELEATGADRPGWVGGANDGTRTVRVARYYYLDYEKTTLVQLANGEVVKLADAPKDVAVLSKRTIDIPKLKICDLNAVEILETYETDFRYVPIIPVIANEENINGERKWEGIVGPAMDAQRAYNYMVSAEVETIALAPKSPWLVAEGQLDDPGYKQIWQNAAVKNYPFLPYKATGLGGTPIPPPQRQFAEPPIQAIAMGVHQADADINATSGFYDPSRGNLSSSERSGVALQALQRKSEEGNSGYLDQLASVSMTYEAKVILDMLPHVYDRPGRIIRIIGINDEQDAVMLGQPFVKQQGQPQLAPAGTPNAEMFDLSKGIYSVTVSVGKAYTTAREEAADRIGQILQAEPQLLTVIGDIYFDHLDGPGMHEIAERLKKALPPQLRDEEGDQPDPAALQQQNAALQQQLQEATQLADANKAKLMATQLQTESQEKIKAAEIESKQQIEGMKAELERMKVFVDTQIAQVKAEAERAKIAGQLAVADQQMQHDRESHHLDLQASREQAHADHVHDSQIEATRAASKADSTASR
jgi:hypothetical protein